MNEGIAEAAQSEEAVGDGIERKRGDGLVAADVERADGDLAIWECFEDVRELGGLLVFAREARFVDVEELCAEETDGVRAVLSRQLGLGWGGHVGGDDDGASLPDHGDMCRLDGRRALFVRASWRARASSRACSSGDTTKVPRSPSRMAKVPSATPAGLPARTSMAIRGAGDHHRM